MYVSATPIFSQMGMHPKRISPKRVRDASKTHANVTLELSCTVISRQFTYIQVNQ